MSTSGHESPLTRSRSRSPASSGSSQLGNPYGLAPSPLRNGSPVSALYAPLDTRRSSLSRVVSVEEMEGISLAVESSTEEENARPSLLFVSGDEDFRIHGPIGREASPRPSLHRNDTSGRTITDKARSTSRSTGGISLDRNLRSGDPTEEDDGGITAIPTSRLEHRFSSTSSRRASARSPIRIDFTKQSRSRGSHSSQVTGLNVDDLFEQREREEEARSKDTFYQERSFTVNEPVGSLSISPSNRDICLASRKGLFILDMQYTDQAPRKIPQGGTWQIADCQWSPHPSHSNLILTTSSQKLLVWDLLSTSPSSSLSRIIPACNRAVTDINWHATLPDLMATTGIDGSVKVWDLRVKTEGLGMGQATNRFSEWGQAGTQVKWNRQHENILASSHDNSVRIWDTRKGSVPVTTIDAHDGRIYGIDWDRRTRHQIVTCSLDRTIKYWSIDELDRANSSRYTRNPYFPSLPAPQAPDSIIRTNSPVWRARNLPFGRGVLSLPQRGESSLEMWGQTQGDGPIERFEEYSAPVKDFVWRTRGGQNPGYEDREFQLITWHKDRQLRATPVSADVLERAGYVKGAKIDVLVSRRNAPNISYASWDHGLASTMAIATGSTPVTAHSESGFFPMSDSKAHWERAMSVKTTTADSVALGNIAGRAKPPIAPFAAKAVMTRGTLGGRQKRSKAVDQMDWIGGITVKRFGKQSATASAGSSVEPSRVGSRVRLSEARTSSRDRQPLSMMSASLLNRAVGASSGLPMPRRESDHTEVNETASLDMADEIRQIKRIYPRVKFKGADLDFRKRRCSVGVNGPWAEKGHFVYVQAYFRFPRSYQDGPVICELANNVQVEEQVRQRMQTKLDEICRDNRDCLLPCVEYLLATDQRKSRQMTVGDDSGSDSEPEQTHRLSLRTSGASFGPDGQLVCFFPKALPTRKRLMSSSRSPTRDGDRALPRNRLTLLKAMSALSRMSDAKDSGPLQGPPDFLLGGGYSNLITAGLARHHARSHERGGTFSRPSTILQVRDFSVLQSFDHGLARTYRLTGGAQACIYNADLAESAGRDTASTIWTAAARALGEAGTHPKSPLGPHRVFQQMKEPREQAIIRTTMLRAMFDLLCSSRDVQTLAVMVVLIAEATSVRSKDQTAMQKAAARLAADPTHRSQDYFQPRRAQPGRSEISERPPGSKSQLMETPLSPSVGWQVGSRGLASHSGFSQFSRGLNSFRSNISAIALRPRQDSEVSLYAPSQEAGAVKPVSAIQRRKERSASPRKDSFRSHAPYRNAESFSPDLEGITFSRSHDLQAGTPSADGEHVGRSPHRLSALGPIPPARLPSENKRARSQLGRQSHVAASRNNATAHSPWLVTSVDSRAARNDGDSLLERGKLAQYECWRLAYADLLFRAQMYQQRTAILQLDLARMTGTDDREITVDIRKRSLTKSADRRSRPAHNESLEISPACIVCGQAAYSPSHQRADDGMSSILCSGRKAWPNCIVCRLPVRGLAKTCFTCLHVSHQRCAKMICDSSGPRCPTACDCACGENGGFRGMFDTLESDGGPAMALEYATEAPTFLGVPKLDALGMSELEEPAPPQDARRISVAETRGNAIGYRAYAKAQVRRMAGENLPNWL